MSNPAFTIDQIDAWSKATEEGERLLTEGRAAEVKASQAEQRKIPLTAAESYAQAIARFQQAIQILKDPAELAHDHVAIRTLSNNAREQRKEAQKLLDKLQPDGKDSAVTRCQKARSRAEELLKEASRALEANDNTEARSKATEASELDQSLSEKADEIKRAADTPGGEQDSRTSIIVVGVLLLVLLILAIIFGPKLWAWISEFLFPAIALLPLFGY